MPQSLAEVPPASASLGDDWLLAQSRDVYSQFGEDGILAAILGRLPELDRWCVEFGAWDGAHLSNTRRLIEEDHYSAVLIEGDPSKFRQLRAATSANSRITALEAYVGFTAQDGLDSILPGTTAPRNFDLLSIDIDGNDYHVFAAVEQYRPKVVVIEFNPTIPNEIDFVQAADLSVNQGSSLTAIDRLARSKSYSLVAVTRANALFVDDRYFPRFEINDNSVARLRRDVRDITHFFTGFDGRCFFSGNREMPWHDLQLDDARLQMLPPWCHVFPPRANRWQRLYLKLRRHLARWHAPRCSGGES